MNTLGDTHKIKILKEMIEVIRAEQQKRWELLINEEPNFARDQWLFKEEPFVNELCLLVLVTLRHHVERELVSLAARALNNGEEISSEQYRENHNKLKKKTKGSGLDWTKINDKLDLESYKGYKTMDALRLLANSYKHDPLMKPNRKLLELLHLNNEVNYAPLPESNSFREGLAAFVDLGKEVDYCDIVERFINIADNFLVCIGSRPGLSQIKWELRGVSLNPDDMEH